MLSRRAKPHPNRAGEPEPYEFCSSIATLSASWFPSLSLDLDHTDDEFVASAERLEFALFTSDSVETESNNILSLSPLVAPFYDLVWIILATSCFVMATAIAILLHWNGISLRKVFESLNSVMSSLVEQTQAFPLLRAQARGCGGPEMVRKKGMILMWATWLVSATFITNVYNAVFNSNYLLEPVYFRNWTTGLLGMDDFTIFIGFDAPALKDVLPGQRIDGYYLSGHECNAPAADYLRLSMRNPCALCVELIDRDSADDYSTEGLLNRIRFVPTDLLEEVIMTRLTTSKTLYITPTQFAQTDWGYFRTAMKSDKRVKFARNLDPRDGSLEDYSAGYGFTKGLHQRHWDNVPRRLTVIVSSGLLGLWRKWKKFKRLFHQRGNIHDEMLWSPLALWGSDLYYVFALFGLCVASCVGAFALEMGTIFFSALASYLKHNFSN